MKFLESLKDQKFPIVLAAFAFVFVIVSLFDVQDITKLQISRAEAPLYWLAAFGALLFVASLGAYYIESRRDRLPRDLNERPGILPKSVFIAAPMNAFKVAGRPEDYKKSREQILAFMQTLKRECDLGDIYYAGETIRDVGEFDLPGASLRTDFRRIQEREFFILMWPERNTSRSALVEAGIALTLNKKCIYLVRNRDDLPFLLQGAQNATKNVRILRFEDEKDLHAIVRKNRDWLFDFSTPPAGGPAAGRDV